LCRERTLCQSLDDDRTLPELCPAGAVPAPPAMEMIADGIKGTYFPMALRVRGGRLFENKTSQTGVNYARKTLDLLLNWVALCSPWYSLSRVWPGDRQ